MSGEQNLMIWPLNAEIPNLNRVASVVEAALFNYSGEFPTSYEKKMKGRYGKYKTLLCAPNEIEKMIRIWRRK